ncbi:MAG: hypothetical protein LBE13_12225 [Bacteroidales bacterium]|jgi:hypothetical protein|nr:hypothetical protein [Bacteroidales bacterium]
MKGQRYKMQKAIKQRVIAKYHSLPSGMEKKKDDVDNRNMKNKKTTSGLYAHYILRHWQYQRCLQPKKST